MIKTTCIVIPVLLTTLMSFAQEEAATPSHDTQPATESKEWNPELDKPRRSIRENLFFGGYISLSFGDYSVFGIEPMIGYHINPKFSTGLKIRYDYIRDDRYSETLTSSNYGGSIFGRYRITPKFYAQVEPAMYNYELHYFNGTDFSSEREWIPYLFAGGGFRQPLGERSWAYVEVMFDLLMDDKSPYDDWTPFFSIGVGTGF